MFNTLPHLAHLPAHLVLSLGLLFFFLGKTIPGIKKLPATAIFIAMLALAAALEASETGSHDLFFGMVQTDSFSRLYNQLYFIVSALVVVMLHFSDEMDRENDWENYGLLSCLILGMMFMTSASHLLMAVIAIEMVSIPSYLLVALNRKNPASKEASMKYILFGSFATGVMLYGMSFLFGMTGSLTFADIWNGLGSESVGTPIYYLAIGFTLAGMSFKVAAVPFHFWCPDAYQAAPTPITAFLSVAPKVAGLTLMMRFFADHLPVQGDSLTQMLSIVAIVTMVVGSFAALKQTDIKRLLAYSSIAHAGFLMMGVAVLNTDGRQAVFFYIPIYILMNLGAFMAIIYLAQDHDYKISAFNGAVKSNPLLVTAFAVCTLSLAGIPPFAGFVGKFYLFKVAMEKGLYPMILAAGISTVVSLYFYVSLLKVMIIDQEARTFSPLGSKVPVVFVSLCALPLVFLGLYWVPLVDWADKVRLFQ